MAVKLAVVMIHGMGETLPGYSADLRSRLTKGVPKAKQSALAFGEIYYQDILQANQQAVFDRMRPQINWMRLRKFLLFGFSDAASLAFQPDIAGSAYFLAQQAIQQKLGEVYAQAGAQPDLPVLLIAQSLGGHVISNYIWDAQQPAPQVGVWKPPLPPVSDPKLDDFQRLRSLVRLCTTGCNIPLFVAGHQPIVPIAKPTPAFQWLNFFDEDDVLGWPLRPLSAGYDALVEDIDVNAGAGVLGVLTSMTPLSHEQYWQDGDVVDRLVNEIKLLV